MRRWRLGAAKHTELRSPLDEDAERLERQDADERALAAAHRAMKSLAAPAAALTQDAVVLPEVEEEPVFQPPREPSELRENGAAGTVPEVVATLQRWIDGGARRLYLQVLDLADLDHVRLAAAEVVPHL